MTARVASVNAGTVVDVPWGAVKRSAIDKRPVGGAVAVRRLGVDGDEIADLVHHGGADQAVYVFAGEDLDEWSTALGRPLTPGQFGENLTTRGLDVSDARLGERWRIGSTVLEVAGVRIPCSVFQGFLDEPRWVRRFAERGRPGAYLRVITEGLVEAGDAIEVVDVPDHDLTVAFAFRALTTRRDLLPMLAREDRCSAAIKKSIDSAVERSVSAGPRADPSGP